MRTWSGLFAVLFLLGTTHAQESVPNDVVRVRHLTVVSSTLPDGQRRSIIQKLEGIETNAEELQERVGQALRDEGYYNATVNPPHVSSVQMTQDGRGADFTVQVNPGAVYTLGEIRFEGSHVFSAEEMRLQFPSVSGKHFNATEIGKGFENLRNLYASKGFANFGCIPKPTVDEARHTVDLTIDIDEGRAVSFGGLQLEGIEPVAGAGKALLTSWRQLQGELYNPQVLQKWLAANTKGWPDDAAARVQIGALPSRTADAGLDFLLHFQ